MFVGFTAPPVDIVGTEASDGMADIDQCDGAGSGDSKVDAVAGCLA